MKNIRVFSCENFQFLGVKFSIKNRQVFEITRSAVRIIYNILAVFFFFFFFFLKIMNASLPCCAC